MARNASRICLGGVTASAAKFQYKREDSPVQVGVLDDGVGVIGPPHTVALVAVVDHGLDLQLVLEICRHLHLWDHKICSLKASESAAKDEVARIWRIFQR